MGNGSMQEEILQKSIQTEVRARDFYSNMAGKIVNRGAKKQMLKLSKEEEHHRGILEDRYTKLLKKTYVPDMSVDIGDLFTWLGKYEHFNHATALEVVSIGIQSEKDSLEFYKNQLKTVTNQEDVDLLNKLISFEGTHLDSLQKTYERLQKFNFFGDNSGDNKELLEQ